MSPGLGLNCLKGYEQTTEGVTSGKNFRQRVKVNFLMLHQGLDTQKIQRKILNIFLPIIFSICFGCSKEPSH